MVAKKAESKRVSKGKKSSQVKKDVRLPKRSGRNSRAKTQRKVIANKGKKSPPEVNITWNFNYTRGARCSGPLITDHFMPTPKPNNMYEIDRSYCAQRHVLSDADMDLQEMEELEFQEKLLVEEASKCEDFNACGFGLASSESSASTARNASSSVAFSKRVATRPSCTITSAGVSASSEHLLRGTKRTADSEWRRMKNDLE